ARRSRRGADGCCLAPHGMERSMHRHIPEALHWRGSCRRRALPECQLAGYGFGLSLLWEVLQSPFYTDTFTVPWTAVALNRLHCAVGDVLILLAAFWIVALGCGRFWVCMASWASCLAFVALGLAYTAVSEYVNVQVLQRWAYSGWMPMVAGIGLVPLLQWVIVPSVSVHYASKGITRRGWPALARA